MRALTLLRLAFSGSLTDRVRAGLTIFAAILAGLSILATATVLNMTPVPHDSWRYTTAFLNEPGYRPGLIAMVAVTLLPSLVLIAQAARLGGPARDRRLAAMRLAGASPRQCRAIAAAEQGVAVGVGALLAIAAYPFVRAGLHEPGPLLPLPTDTAPAWWAWPLVAVGLPLLAGLVSAVALNQILREPLAPARRARRTRPRLWPVFLIPAALAAMVLAREAANRIDDGPRTLPYIVMGLALVAVCIGVPFAAAGIGYLAAKLALRYGRRPGTLLAARRVLADPYGGSRAVAALLVCTVLSTIVVGWRTHFMFTNEVAGSYGTRRGDDALDRMVTGLLSGMTVTFLMFASVGLLIALVDGALNRRRDEAALIASGTPASLLTRARLGVVLLTAVPGVLLGVPIGYTATTMALWPIEQPASVTTICYDFGEGSPMVPCTPEGLAAQREVSLGRHGDAPYSFVDYRPVGPWRAVQPPVPWLPLALFGGAALAGVVLATGLSLLAGHRVRIETALRTT